MDSMCFAHQKWPTVLLSVALVFDARQLSLRRKPLWKSLSTKLRYIFSPFCCRVILRAQGITHLSILCDDENFSGTAFVSILVVCNREAVECVGMTTIIRLLVR